MVRIGLLVLLVCLASAVEVRGQGGFALLRYPLSPDPSDGDFKRWRPLIENSPPPGWVQGDPIVLTYAIDPNIFPSFSDTQRADAIQAIQNAMQTWSDATNGHLSFVQSQWQAVPGQDLARPATCGFLPTPAARWEGPGFYTDWVSGLTPPPGYGANIEFFSMPENCEIWLPNNNGPFVMTPGILGFAANATEGDHLVTVDLFLNEDVAWTTSSARAMASMSAMRSVVGEAGVPYHCTHLECNGCEDLGDRLDRIDSRMVFDIETVVLHELGHGLGLGHPNEAAAQGGAIFDPFTFEPVCDTCFSTDAVMHGAYTGVKRELAPEELGALAALYKPGLMGDLDASGEVTILDAAKAMDLVSSDFPPNPWEVNLLDFISRNGSLDLTEASQVILWALRPDDYPPNVINPNRGVCLGSKSIVEVRGEVRPTDVGLGGPVHLDLFLENPNQVTFSGWDLDIVYDTSIFSNPQLVEGDFLPDGVFTSLGGDDGQLMFSKISFNDDDSLCGLLGTVVFDVDIHAAAAAETVTFSLENGVLVATCPFVHDYGTEPMETLVVVNGTGIAWDYDVDLSGVVDLEDWYAFGQMMIDTNQDGATDASDWEAMGGGLRMGEMDDVLTAPR